MDIGKDLREDLKYHEHYLKYREEILVRSKQHYWENKDYWKKYHRKRYLKNKEYYNQITKEYYLKNKESEIGRASCRERV